MIVKEEILNGLVKAFDYDKCQEATTIQNEPGVAYEVDLKKDGDTLTIVIEKKELENKDKKEFEAWLDTVDYNMFQEALEKVQKITGIDAKQLDKDYNSNDYKGIINLFKKIIPQIAQEKINNLQRYL
jgi:hypothetical protein